MHGSDDLHAGGVASYRWGGLLVALSADSSASGRLIVELIAGVAAGTLPFEHPREIRACFAILHELIHLEQDLSTGLGAWDHLETRWAYPRLVHEARWFVTKFTDPPYDQAVEVGLVEASPGLHDAFSRDLEAIRARTVALRLLAGGQWATEPVRASLLQWEDLTITDELAAAYGLRQILEGEAACEVDQQVRASRGTEETLAEVERYRDRWNVLRMPDEYRGPIRDVIEASTNGGSTEGVGASFPAYLALTCWLLDLVQSYPPPSVQETFADESAMFDPVARYLAMVRALNRIPQEPFTSMIEALSENDRDGAEAALLEWCRFPYPSSRSIYEAWIPIIEERSTADEWDAPLFKLRLAAIRYRLETGEGKGIAPLVYAGMPLQMLVEGRGIRGLLSGEQLLVDVGDPLKEALIARATDLELFDLLIAGRSFSCPLARGHICTARLPSCSAGFERLILLPSEEGCAIRRTLQSFGYAIQQPGIP
jgi:hypothetical protein